MSITEINEKINEIIDDLGELRHVDSTELDAVRTKLEDIQTELDNISNTYGDDTDDTLSIDDDDEYEEDPRY